MFLDFENHPVRLRGEVVEKNERRDRDDEPCRGRDQRLADAAGELAGMGNPFFADHGEGADHAEHRTRQPEEGGDGDA